MTLQKVMFVSGKTITTDSDSHVRSNDVKGKHISVLPSWVLYTLTFGTAAGS